IKMAKNVPSALSEFLARIKGVYDSVGGLFSLFDAAVVSISSVLPTWVTTSTRLRAVIAIGAVAGGLLGYFLIPFFWKGASQSRRFKRVFLFLMLLAYALLLDAVALLVINPEMAQRSSWMESLREFLLINPFVLNAGFLSLSALGSFGLVSAITVMSPLMKR